jgi:hypothetical protein
MFVSMKTSAPSGSCVKGSFVQVPLPCYIWSREAHHAAATEERCATYGRYAVCSPSLPSVNAFVGPVAMSLLSLGQERILKGVLAQGTGGVKE